MEKPVLLERLPNKPYERVRGIFQCSCGNKFEARINNVNTGQVQSCGCLRKVTTSKLFTTHGLRNKNKSLYSIWKGMRRRCNNKNDSHYHLYGAKGIKVCEKWNEFPSFYEWAMANGYKEGLSIERLKNNLGYNPDNCTWIPLNEQARNRTITLGVANAKIVAERLRNGADYKTLAKEFGVGIDAIRNVKRGKTYKNV